MLLITPRSVCNVWVCGSNPWVKPLKGKLQCTKSNFAVVLFIVLCRVVLILQSVDEILKCDHSNETFWALLSCGGLLCWTRLVLNFESVDEILKCADLYESYLAAVHAVYYSFKGECNFLCLWIKSNKWKLLCSAFLCCCLIFCKSGAFITFTSMEEILKGNQSNESG